MIPTSTTWAQQILNEVSPFWSNKTIPCVKDAGPIDCRLGDLDLSLEEKNCRVSSPVYILYKKF